MTTETKLTKEQAKRYFESNGTQCPFCDSDQIAGDEIDIDGGVAGQDVRCNECGRSWRDNYRLSSISTYEGEYFEKEEEPKPGCKVISVGVEAKCGCCNYEASEFFALDGQNPLPGTVTDDDDVTPLDDYKEIFEKYKQFGEPIGMCGECFTSWLEEAGIKVVNEV
jgi:hypothetical protein